MGVAPGCVIMSEVPRWCRGHRDGNGTCCTPRKGWSSTTSPGSRSVHLIVRRKGLGVGLDDLCPVRGTLLWCGRPAGAASTAHKELVCEPTYRERGGDRSVRQDY